MIFVTLGTERFPFNRLLKVLEILVGEGKIVEPVFVQNGHTEFRSQTIPSKNFMSHHEFTEKISSARIVVSHAGVGTTLLCAYFKKIPILVPRCPGFGEHLDDHQAEFAQQMSKDHRAIILWDPLDLADCIGCYDQLVTKCASFAEDTGKDLLIRYLSDLTK